MALFLALLVVLFWVFVQLFLMGVSWFLLVCIGGIIIGRFNANHTLVAALIGFICAPFMYYLIQYALGTVSTPFELSYARENWMMLSLAVFAVYSGISNLFKPYKGIDG